MSGGALTDYTHDLFRLDEWAERLKPENPLLTEMMHALSKVLYDYDEYMSGDIGKERVSESWERFHEEWIGVSKDDLTDRIAKRAKGEAESYVDRVTLGYDPKPKWWEGSE